jgi:FG-GAP repeat protein
MGAGLRNWKVRAWLGVTGLLAGTAVLALPSAGATAAVSQPHSMALAQAPAALQAAAQRALGRPAASASLVPRSASKPAPGDRQGAVVAISGATAVVGAPGVHSGRGAVYIFARSGDTWSQQATLNDPRQRANDSFGSAVAVSSTASGTFALIGAEGQGKPERAFVYARSGTKWHRQATLAGPAGSSPYIGGFEFGYSVAISSTTAVVATVQNQLNGLGGLYVFGRSGTAWHRQAILLDPDEIGEGNFGASVAVSGATIVAGAPNDNCAFVFTRSGQTWTTQAALTQRGEAATCPIAATGAGFGSAVTISGSTAVIGSDGAPAFSARGLAYVFTRSGTTWTRQATLRDPRGANGDEFGWAVTMSGTRVVVGAPFKAASRHCGTAYEFTRSSKGWHERSEVINPDCVSGDDFGWATAISGKTAMIGAPGVHKNAGTVYEQVLP